LHDEKTAVNVLEQPYNSFLLLLLCLTASLSALPYGNPLVLNYDRQLYQAENQNWSVAVRDDGMVFIGNNDGLLQTDGFHWKLSRLPDHPVIRSVAVTSDNRIYVGGFEAFGYFQEDETGELSYHPLSNQPGLDNLHNDEFWRIIPLNDKIYFQSFSSIFVYDGSTVHKLDVPGNVVLLQKVGERLFIDMINRGLHELKEDRLVPLPGMKHLHGDEVKMVLPYGDEHLLLGAAKNGLFIYNGEEAHPWKIDAAEEIRDAEINNGLFLDGQYLIGTIAGGLYIIGQNGRLMNHLHAGNVLQNNTILAIAADAGKNVWLGLDRGIDHLIRDNGMSFYLDPTGELGTVYDAAWYDDALWLGTNLGLIRMGSDNRINFKSPELIRGTQGQVWDLFTTDDELLVGHNSGTYKIRNGQLSEISTVNGGFDIKLYDNGSEQVLIQSSYSSINIYRKGPDGWQFSHAVKGIIEPFSEFEIDPYGNIWAAHLHRNIFRIKLNETLDSIISLRTFGMAEGFPHEKKISVSKIDNRVVFPAGEKIYTYDDLIDTIIPYQRMNSAVGMFRSASHIIASGYDHYWFIRNQCIGSYRISGSDIDSLFSYNLAMQGMQLGKSFPRIVRLNKEQSLICLDKGFIIYFEQNQDRTTLPEKTFLRKITAEGSHQQVKLPLTAGEDPVSVAWPERNLSFTFSTLPHYKTPHYRHRLEGLEEKWNDWSESSEARYERLPPGHYTFKVQARNIHGSPGPVTAYPLIIRPPWFFSILALVSYVILILAIVLLIRRSFLRKLLLHTMKVEEEKQEKMRLQKIQAEQEFIRLKNELLQKDLDHKNNQLADYTMTIIRKNEVLMKVKEEIEKQKEELSDRYPNYLYEKLMKLLDYSITSEDEWKVFEYHFDQTHENFFKRLKKNYPELTPGDLKLCAYLRMNLSSKELAPLLNINHKSVEVHRSRLRKKLKLTPEDNLVEFLLDF
jgi:DNA-binding CsgD family transcriptional regulator